MPFQLFVMYHHPDDPAAFDAHYRDVHTPLAHQIPGVRDFSIVRPTPGADGSRAPYHQVAVLTFDDEAAFGAGMGSPQGQAAVADAAGFATNGFTLLTGPIAPA